MKRKSLTSSEAQKAAKKSLDEPFHPPNAAEQKRRALEWAKQNLTNNNSSKANKAKDDESCHEHPGKNRSPNGKFRQTYHASKARSGRSR